MSTTQEADDRRGLHERNLALAELVASKTELVSALLHELRTPLAAAVAVAGLLPERTGDPLLDDTLPMLSRNLRRIEDVISEIATISGIESGTIEMDARPFDLVELVAEVAAPLPVGPAGGGLLTGDRERLALVLRRLLAAVRTLGGEPSVSVTAGDRLWCVAFRLPSHRPADRCFTAAGGQGNTTALMLAKAVVGRHGGSVAVETSEGTPYLRLRLPA